MEDMAKISVVGLGMRNHPGVAATFFEILAGENIPVLLVTTSEIKISAVISREYLQKAAQKLAEAFSLINN
jgi:aspartate kinase